MRKDSTYSTELHVFLDAHQVTEILGDVRVQATYRSDSYNLCMKAANDDYVVQTTRDFYQS